MSSMPEQWIRSCVEKGNIKFTEHAIQRMNERGIRRQKIIECIMCGKVINNQDHGRDIKITFQEPTNTSPIICTVIAACNPPEIVTVYYINEA